MSELHALIIDIALSVFHAVTYAYVITLGIFGLADLLG